MMLPSYVGHIIDEEWEICMMDAALEVNILRHTARLGWTSSECCIGRSLWACCNEGLASANDFTGDFRNGNGALDFGWVTYLWRGDQACQAWNESSLIRAVRPAFVHDGNSRTYGCSWAARRRDPHSLHCWTDIVNMYYDHIGLIYMERKFPLSGILIGWMSNVISSSV